MTENKTERKLIEKIANKLKVIMPCIILDYINNNEIVELEDCEVVADQLLALIKEALPELAKEAGFIPPSEVITRITTKDLTGFIDMTSLHNWAKANGYVKLAEDQGLPISLKTTVYKRSDYQSRDQKIMLKAGFRRVILEEKDDRKQD